MLTDFQIKMFHSNLIPILGCLNLSFPVISAVLLLWWLLWPLGVPMRLGAWLCWRWRMLDLRFGHLWDCTGCTAAAVECYHLSPSGRHVRLASQQYIACSACAQCQCEQLYDRLERGFVQLLSVVSHLMCLQILSGHVECLVQAALCNCAFL